MHPRASVYIYDRPNENGLVAVSEGPYPLIPKVPPMKRASSVHTALAAVEFDETYVFAVARSYIAEKFVRGKRPATVHMSVLAVERKIKPRFLPQFNQARLYFSLPTSYLYRDSVNPSVLVAGVPVNRLDYDDPHAPPAYTESASVHSDGHRTGAHCCTCTCAAHGAPPYEETDTLSPTSSRISSQLSSSLLSALSSVLGTSMSGRSGSRSGSASPSIASSPTSSPSHSPRPSASSASMMFIPLSSIHGTPLVSMR